MVEVCGPLPRCGHVLVVVEPAEAVALLLGADHGHLRIVVGGIGHLLKEREREGTRINLQCSTQVASKYISIFGRLLHKKRFNILKTFTRRGGSGGNFNL